MSRIRLVVPASIILVVAAAVVFGVLARPAQAPSVAPTVGHAAPDFTLQSATGGRSVSLSSYRGHTVLLNFFATWCVPCRKEMPEIERAVHSTAGRLVVLGIDKQEPAGDVNSMRRDLRITYPLLLDNSLTAWQRYRVALQPVSFWVDAKGTVRAIHYGPMSASYIERQVARLQA